MLDRLHAVLTRLSRMAAWAGGGALALAAVMVTLDVLSRKFIGVTMSGSDEITGYVFAGATAWAYSYCLLHRANVRIDAFYNFLPRWLRASLDLLSLLLLSIFVAALVWRAFFTFYNSLLNDTHSITPLGTPLWIPQAVWVGGLLFFLLTLVFQTVYTAVVLARGDFATVNRVAGVLSVSEEAAEEIRGAEAERRRIEGTG